MEPKDLRSSYNPNLPHFDMSSDDEKDSWVIEAKEVDLFGSMKSVYNSTVSKAKKLWSPPKNLIASSDLVADNAAKNFKKLDLADRDTKEQTSALRDATDKAKRIFKGKSSNPAISVNDMQGTITKREWFPALAAFVNTVEFDPTLKVKFLDFEAQMLRYFSGKGNNNIPKKEIKWLLLNHFSISKIKGDPQSVEAAVRDLLNPSKWVEGIYKHYGKDADQLVIGFILDFPEVLGLDLDDKQRIQAAKDYAFLQNLSQSALPKEQKNELNRLFDECKEALTKFYIEDLFFNVQLLHISELAEAYRHPAAPVQPSAPIDVISELKKAVRESNKSQTKSSVVTIFKALDDKLKVDKFLALRTLLEARDVLDYQVFNERLDLLQNQLTQLLDDYIQDPEEVKIAVEKTMNLIFEKSGFNELDPNANPIPAMLQFLNNDKAVFTAFFEEVSGVLKLSCQQFCDPANAEQFAILDARLEAFFKDLPGPKPVLERFALKFKLLDYLSRECDPTAFLKAGSTEQTNRLFHPILIAFKDMPHLQLIINLRQIWGTKGIQYTSLNTKLDEFLRKTGIVNNDGFKNYLFDQLLGAALSAAKESEKSLMTELSLLIAKGDNIAKILYRTIIAEYLANLPPSMPPLRALEGVRDFITAFDIAFEPKSHQLYEDLNFLANFPFVAGNEPYIFGIIKSLNQPDYAEAISQIRKELQGDFFTKIGPAAVEDAKKTLGGVRSKEGYLGAVGMRWAGEWEKPPNRDQPKPIERRQFINWLSALKGDPLTDFICLVQVMNTSPDDATLRGYFNFTMLMRSIFETMNLSVDEQRVFLANLVTPYFAKIKSDALPAALCDIDKSDVILMAMVESAFPDQQVSDERTLGFLTAVTRIAPTFPQESNLLKISEHITRILGAFKTAADKEVVVSYLQDLIRARVLPDNPNQGGTDKLVLTPKQVFTAVLTALYYLDDLEPLLEFLRDHPDILKEVDPLKKLNKAVDLMLAVARQEKSNEGYVALLEGLKVQINQVQGIANPNAKEVYWIRKRLLDCERALFQGNGHTVLTDFTMAIGRVNLSLQVGNFINRAIANLIQGYVKTNEEKGLLAKMAGKTLINEAKKWTVNSEKLPAALNLLREPLVDLIGRISTKDLLKTILDEFSGDLVFGTETALSSLNHLDKADRKKQIESFYNARAALSNILYLQFIQPVETNPVSLGNIPLEAMLDFLSPEDTKKTLKAELKLDESTYWKFVKHVAQQWSNELEHYANAKPMIQEIIKEYWAKSVNVARDELSRILYQEFINPIEANAESLGNISRQTMEDFLFAENRKKELMAKFDLGDYTYRLFVQHVAQHWSVELKNYAKATPTDQEIIKEFWAKSVNPGHKNDIIVKNIANLLKKYVDGPVNQFIEAKLPIGKEYAINWVRNKIDATLNSTLDQILKSGHDGWLLLGLLEPLIPAQVPLPVDNGGAPNRLNTYKNPKLEIVSGELARPLLHVVSKRGGYGVSSVAKVANAIVPISFISTNLSGSVLGPVFQGLESINIPQLVSQLSKGLSKPSFPSQVDQIAFDKKASDILGGLIALKREITTLERDKPEGWENTILGKKMALHAQNADLFKLLNESPYAADAEIFKVYQEEIVTDKQAEQFLHDALLAQYTGKLNSLLGEDFAKRTTLFLPYTGVETLVGGLKRVLQEIGGGLPDYLTSPLFAKKFGEIVQKVVVISLMEQLEKSDEHIHIEEYKQ